MSTVVCGGALSQFFPPTQSSHRLPLRQFRHVYWQCHCRRRLCHCPHLARQRLRNRRSPPRKPSSSSCATLSPDSRRWLLSSGRLRCSCNRCEGIIVRRDRLHELLDELKTGAAQCFTSGHCDCESGWNVSSPGTVNTSL